MLHIPHLYIADTNEKGRGVFTAEGLEPGDFIEACPIIKIPHDQIKLMDQTILYDYYFSWEEPGYKGCVVLGYGSLYNHSPEANAQFIVDYVDDMIKIVCDKPIAAGGEITIDYTGEGLMDAKDLWFDVTD